MQLHGKAIIITDLHFGRKQFQPSKTQNTLDYLSSIILTDGAPENVFILGDIYDHRKIIDWNIFDMVNNFFRSIKHKNIVVVVGNHDCYHRNSLFPNSISYLTEMFGVRVIDKTKFLDFNSKKLLFVPWLLSDTDPNNPTPSQIKKADLILGHFEFLNFELLPGVISSHGSDAGVYKGKRVLSGHYHTSSNKNNVHYLGVCEQMTWSDFNTKKGYYVLDEKLNLEFIENCTSDKFLKIYYNDTQTNPIRLEGLNVSLYYCNIKDIIESGVNSNLKIYIESNANKIDYHNFIITLDMNNIEYVIIDVSPEMQNLLHTGDIQQDESISEMLVKLLEDDIQPIFKEIYSEAMVLDDQ